MIDEAVCMVREFQAKANQATPNNPCKISTEQIEKRIKWITGELEELREAKNEYEQADALVDALYYLLGAFVDMGLDVDNLFSIVHSYNMKKIAIKTCIKKDRDSKVLKPDGWVHPDEEIKAEINRQKSKQTRDV